MRTTTTASAIDASAINASAIGPTIGSALDWHEDDLAVQFGSAPLAADDAPADEIGVLGAAGLAVLAMTAALVALGSVLLG